MSVWLQEMDGYYKNTGQEFTGEPTWKVFAELLAAAKAYE
jgi:hypothetical protein